MKWKEGGGRVLEKGLLTARHYILIVLPSPSEKTQSNGEEWFVDKSRNIGVSSGERDLKLQVKRKKSERRTLKAKNSDYKSLCKVSKQLLQCEDYRNSLNYLNQVC